MKITNRHNLPAPLYNAVKDVYPPKPGRLSVTRLIGSPYKAKLIEKYWDELEEDVIERIWALMGQAMDSVLTKYAPKHWIVQEKLEQEVNGIIVVGKVDYLDPETGVLGDWKQTSVWSYILGGRSEWEKQLNIYDWLEVRKGGLYRQVNKLIAQRHFRDWSRRKAQQDSDYPPRQFMELELPRWSHVEQGEYVKKRVQLHLALNPPVCTPEERWEKPTTYAVMKKGRKSALRVLNELAFAKTWCIDNEHAIFLPKQKGAVQLNAGIEIVKRLGECVHCKDYCIVRNHCPFWKEKNATNNLETD